MLAARQLAVARVLEAWNETPSLRAMRLALPPDLASAHERPGQLVRIRTTAGDACFALTTPSSPGGVTELLVRRGGRVADAAVAAAVPGDALDVSAPFGKGFPIEEARGRDVLLFAAGSGIAPIRALVQHILADRPAYHRVTLFYGQRRGGEFAYEREHPAWQRSGVRVVLCPSREDESWPGARGRVQEVARSIAFGGSPLDSSVAFVCGMAAMVDDVKATLARAGVPPARVHLNY